MRKKGRLISEVAVVLALSANYMSITLLNTVWRLETFLLFPMLLIVSLLMGMVTMDTKKALIYACITVFIGTALTTLVMVLPPMVLGEGASVVDSALNTALISVSKLLIFSVVVFIVGAILGSFLGEWLEPIEEFEI